MGWLLILAVSSCAPGDFRLEVERGRAELRQQHRAYDGAPPVIPHPVAALGRENCLDCHRQGLDLEEEGLAPSTPHPELTNCRQCHLEQQSQLSVPVPNSFQGNRHPAAGPRPYQGAPPTLPHPLEMRSNCLGCHGKLGGSPIRTPHPDRTNCRQCHILQEPVRPRLENEWRKRLERN
ncbi:MAG: hypothetical protein ACE5JX_07395 [Acidobacteriota bacterium]